MESTISLQHNILYSRSDQKIKSTEHYFPEHALGIMLSGESQYFTNAGTFVMKEGAICLLRRNQLFQKLKNLDSNGEPIALISIFLDQNSLRQYAAENSIPKQGAYKDRPMIDLTGNLFLKSFFDSLLPYLDHPKKLTAKIAELKTCEAIELLLETGDVFRNFLFDFHNPHKIDLEAYMNHNYKYNIPLSSFAKLTGRSLSTVKRDFIKIFETTPEKWLQQKRLEQAHFFILKKNLRPSDVYLEVGFENQSHFSFAFKRLFGVTPTQLTEQKRNTSR
ncbi:AraC family transcriptional regulator [Segetibacter sp. 3557_3]|uniref:helix-turn-helix domain-containing protein n=1 Tax=Segetibacter sp. 3557_3 TaxID=2547429 RepID=UPI0010591A0C|nr:AraC family transcriptional regulator [Segetibacter sp. 3557_3]TDH26907.1 AraC family transcriptional regulator [Segetibacter sp. 3557_3]